MRYMAATALFVVAPIMLFALCIECIGGPPAIHSPVMLVPLLLFGAMSYPVFLLMVKTTLAPDGLVSYYGSFCTSMPFRKVPPKIIRWEAIQMVHPKSRWPIMAYFVSTRKGVLGLMAGLMMGDMPATVPTWWLIANKQEVAAFVAAHVPEGCPLLAIWNPADGRTGAASSKRDAI